MHINPGPVDHILLGSFVKMSTIFKINIVCAFDLFVWIFVCFGNFFLGILVLCCGVFGGDATELRRVGRTSCLLSLSSPRLSSSFSI